MNGGHWHVLYSCTAKGQDTQRVNWGTRRGGVVWKQELYETLVVLVRIYVMPSKMTVKAKHLVALSSKRGSEKKKTFAIVVPFSAVCRLLLFVREIEDAATNKERGESEPIPKYRINDDSVMWRRSRELFTDLFLARHFLTFGLGFRLRRAEHTLRPGAKRWMILESGQDGIRESDTGHLFAKMHLHSFHCWSFGQNPELVNDYQR